MYFNTVCKDLLLLHKAILVAMNVAWESVKANFVVSSRCHFNLHAFSQFWTSPDRRDIVITRTVQVNFLA